MVEEKFALKQLWVSQEAHDYVRKLAYENKLSMSRAATNALLNNIKGDQ
jgi:hypothetical protein